MDEKLRQLERDAANEPAAAGALLRARLRAGDVSMDRVRLAAFLGHEASAMAVDVVPGQPSADLEDWLQALRAEGIHVHVSEPDFDAWAGWSRRRRGDARNDSHVAIWVCDALPIAARAVMGPLTAQPVRRVEVGHRLLGRLFMPRERVRAAVAELVIPWALTAPECSAARPAPHAMYVVDIVAEVEALGVACRVLSSNYYSGGWDVIFSSADGAPLGGLVICSNGSFDPQQVAPSPWLDRIGAIVERHLGPGIEERRPWAAPRKRRRRSP
jgi:hypothetical protein